MRYINIENNGKHGLNFDAILSNLGYCMANTQDDNKTFNNQIQQINLDLSQILLNYHTESEIKKIISIALTNSEKRSCFSGNNEYDIDCCYINYIAEMISCLNDYKNKRPNFINNLFKKKNILDFYTNFFLVLKLNNKKQGLSKKCDNEK